MMLAPLDVLIVVASLVNMMIPVVMIGGLLKLMSSPDAERLLPRGDSYALPDDGLPPEVKLLAEPALAPVRALEVRAESSRDATR